MMNMAMMNMAHTHQEISEVCHTAQLLLLLDTILLVKKTTQDLN